MKKAVSLYGTNISNLSLLPQMADFRLDWSGEVVGEPLAGREEPYTLVLSVADHDGNISTATYKFTIMSDNTPPTVRWSGVAPDGTPVSQAVTGANTLETAPWFHIGYSTEAYINFWFDDYGTGIGNFSVYPPVVSPETQTPPALPMFSADFRNGQSFLLSDFTLSDDATGYRLTAADARGNATTVYFHLDRQPPEIIISTIVIHKVPGSYSIDVRGIAKDSVAGLAAPVKLSWMSGPMDQPPGPFWPAGPSEERFAFIGLQPAATPPGRENNFMFYTFDKSGLANYSYLPMSYELRPVGFTAERLSLEESIIPQLILGEVNFKAENPKPPPNCSFIEPPAGMRAKLIIEPRTPTPGELAVLNNSLSAFSDTYIEDDYTPVPVPLTLYDVDQATSVTRDWDEVLPRFVRFSTELSSNTNSTRISCPCSNGVGLCEGSEPPGGYNYLTSDLATLKAFTIYPPLEQPAARFVPPGLNVRLAAGNLEIIFSEVSEGGKLFIKKAERYPEIPGYRIVGNNAWDLIVEANYKDLTIKACIGNSNLSASQVSGAELYHYSGTSGVWEKVTTGRADGCVTGVSQSASPFVVMVPVEDKTAPETNYGFRQGVQAVVNNKFYVSTGTYVNYYADDFTIKGDISGVATVYNLIDIEPTPECLATGFNPTAQKGTCANPRYTEPFKLSEGIHSLYYFSADKSLNTEAPKTLRVYSDGTPPVTAIFIGTGPVSNGGAAYITDTDLVSLNITDPESHGVASDIKDVYCLVDVSPDSCQTEPDLTGPVCTCRNPLYAGPFTLEVGTHAVYYTAVDNVGNREPMRSAEFTVTTSTELAAFSVTPSSGPIGQPIIVAGSGFGAYSAAASRLLLSGTTIQITSWTNARIAAKVPGRLSPGAYELSVGLLTGGVWSFTNPLGFTITSPAVASVSPSSGPIGQAIVLSGSGFGQNGGAAISRVLLGGTTAQVASWTDSRIAAKVPGALTSGDYGLVVERLFDGATISASVASFVVTTPFIASVIPSSGPIGQPVVIAGSGFGQYISSIATRVLLGGATAQVTSWTDAKITTKVPGSLGPLDYELIVERNFEGGTSRDTAPFFVTAPGIEALAPSSGPIGQVIQITGSGFGRYISSTTTRVLLGGAAAPVSSWTDAKITARVPGELAPGEHEFVVERMFEGSVVRASTGPFTVTVPAIASVVPSSGPIGQLLTITGSSFGQYLSSAATRVLFGETAAQVVSWTDGKITARIPGALAAGDYQLSVDRAFGVGVVRVSTGPFTVTAPEIIFVAVSSGPIGQPIIISGSGFGQYGGAAVSRVLFGGTTAQITSWIDSRITAKVPGSLAPGSYGLVVERLYDGAAVSDSVGSFLVTTPVIASVSLSSGPIGQPVVIGGSGFGQYGGTAVSRVLLGDATAQIVSWSDSRIIAKVPGALGVGDYPLSVERLYDGARVSDPAGTFTVTTPVITSVVPSSGPIGQAIALAGSGFGQYGGAAVSHVLFGDTTAQITSWRDSGIIARVPPALTAGNYQLTVERVFGGVSVSAAAGPFAVIVPSAQPVFPSSGPVASVFSIPGTNFGKYVSSSVTRVLIGGVPAPLTYWSDTLIRGRLPYLPAGEYPVVMERVFGGAAVSSPAGTMTLLEPVMAGLSPAAGKEGSLFTVYGAGFGAYYSGKVNGEAAVRVKLGGLSCRISSWSDTRIRALVPSPMAAGSYPVRVERATTYGEGCTAGCAVLSNELAYEVVAGTFTASAVRRPAALHYSAPEPADQTAELPVSARWGGYVATGGGAAVSVPENAIPGLQSDTLSDDGGIFLPDEVAEDYLGEGSSGESSQEAMPSETLITISSDQSGAEDQAARQAAMGVANLAPAGPAVVYGPEGLEFLTPVEMTLPCSPVMLAAAQSGLQDVAVYVWEPVPGRWAELPGVSTSTAGGVCAVKGFAAHFSLYQVLARLTVPAASADFRLGEVYVYPDPAKGGKIPTFHIEAGVADKVTLRIYTVSGRLVHEREMTGTPPIIDDGNGQSYAYEYAWVGHIPSGVYHYVVTSEKAGRKLRARGRFAVVR